MQMNHCVRIPPNNYLCEEIMAKKWAAQPTNLPKDTDLSPLVAASLAGIVYQARSMRGSRQSMGPMIFSATFPSRSSM